MCKQFTDGFAGSDERKEKMVRISVQDAFFLLESKGKKKKVGLTSFVVFFLEPTDENMSVLPTNAAVFYGIFIDKDVDIF